MSDLLEAPIENPTPTSTLTLSEQVRKIIAEADKPLPFAKIKSSLKLAGVILSGKSKVTDEEIQKELEAEGVFVHPAKSEAGKPAYWHTKHVTAEEKAAAKVAEAERKKAAKAEEVAQKAAEKVRLKEEASAATAKAKADKADEALRIKNEKAEAVAKEKAEKAAAVAKEKADKAEAAAKEKADKAEAIAKAKAEKEAEAARKKVAVVVDALHKQVAAMGDKVVILKKPAKASPEAAEAFEKTLKQLLDEKQLFAHPGGKYGKKALLPWNETDAGKKKFDALVKAAEKVLEIGGVSADEVFTLLKQRLGAPKPEVLTSSKPFDLADFAKRVLVVAAATDSHARPYQNKVFISAAWHDSQKAHDFTKMSLEQFKQHLREANGKRLLSLSQANEVQMMDPKLVAESETIHAGSPFHFIRLEGDNP